MLIIERDEGAIRLSGNSRIEGIRSPQSMLSGQTCSVLRYACIQWNKRDIGKMSDSEGKRKSLCRIVTRTADRTGHFRQHQGKQEQRDGLIAKALQQTSASIMTRLSVIETVDPHTGINRVHQFSAAWIEQPTSVLGHRPHHSP